MNELTLETIQIFLAENQFDLKSSHNRICFPIIRRIYLKLIEGQRFDPIKVENDIIINGHHRYICLSILKLEAEKITWTKSPSTETIPWDNVIVDHQDWETEYEIKKHNKIWHAIQNDLIL